MRTTPSSVRTWPGTATPMPATTRESSSTCMPEITAAVMLITSVAVGIRSYSCRITRRTWPSRPTSPMVSTSISGLTAIAVTSGRMVTTGLGRPTWPRESGSRSSTRPRSTRSVTRLAMVERFLPVRLLSAARETGPVR